MSEVQLDDFFEVPPPASSMIEGLRDYGYTIQTAIADIVDNSVTYQSTKIDIYAINENGSPVFAISDNGIGMSDDELRIAMQPGSKSPVDKRPITDLGRFGLGLKTASFSQARVLTVISKKDGETSAYEWDLDHVQRVNRWEIRKIKNFSEVPFFEKLSEGTGTLVVWQKVDRMGHGAGEKIAEQTFTRSVALVHEHLGLVFHRFIDGTVATRKKMVLTINKKTVVSRNPFNLTNLKTIGEEPDVIRYRKSSIKVQAFTLPHPKVVSADEWKTYEGINGYYGSQGFYLYRSDRLIVAGDWFRIIPKSPSTKLLRVSLDISNENDSEWRINVLKSSAQPPVAIRRELESRLQTWTENTKRVYSRRAKPLASSERVNFWNRIPKEGTIEYRINEGNPVLKSFSEALTKEQKANFQDLLSFISSTIPFDSLFLDLNDNHQQVEYSTANPDQLMRLARTISGLLREANPDVSAEEIRMHLRMNSIFEGYEDLISNFESSELNE